MSDSFSWLRGFVSMGGKGGIVVCDLEIWNPFFVNSGVTGFRVMSVGAGWSGWVTRGE